MKEKREGRFLSIGTGVPVIIMMFVILGMTMLAVLTYLHASSTHKVVLRKISYSEAYYEADAIACAVLEDLQEHGEKQAEERWGVEIVKKEEGYSYDVFLRSKGRLHIEVDEELKAVCWQLVKEEER